MFVFGGQSLIGNPNIEGGPRGAIYILDVPSLTWKRGPDVNPTHNRSGMACTVAGDGFIAWGGMLHRFSFWLSFETILKNCYEKKTSIGVEMEAQSGTKR
jgi:hypothetical protein